MSELDWLLSRPSIALPSTSHFRADDEKWRASVERIAVSSTLDVFLNDIQLHQDLHVQAMDEGTEPRLVGYIPITGGVNVTRQDGSRVNPNRETGVILRRHPRPALHSLKAGTRFRAVAYVMDLGHLARLLETDIPPALRPLFGDKGEDCIVSAPSDGALRNTARKLLMPKLNGPLMRLEMEGLVMQLLARQLAALPAHPSSRLTELSARERAAILEARERLLADMGNPPTLGELAAAVGVSEKRLNAGFRLMFGATVFETLRNERLDQAREALESAEVSLKRIAYRVGYNHVSNFVHAFRGRFGMPPGRYLDDIRESRRRHPRSADTATDARKR